MERPASHPCLTSSIASNGGSEGQQAAVRWRKGRAGVGDADAGLEAVLSSIDLMETIMLLTSDDNPRAVALQLFGVCKRWQELAKQLPVWQHLEWAACARHSATRPDTPPILLRHLRTWWGQQLRSFTAVGCAITCELLTDAVASTLFSVAPNLRELRLHACYRVTDAGLAQLAAAQPPLTRFELSWCGGGVSATGLRKVAEACPQLQAFSVSCGMERGALGSVRDDFCRALVHACSKLTQLALCDSAVGDDGLAALARGYGRQLTSLALSYTHAWGDRGMQAVARHCVGLRRFEAAGVDCLSDEGLGALARGCPLEYLDVSSCVGISHGGLWAAIAGCRTLAVVDAFGAARRDDAPGAREELRARLQVLNDRVYRAAGPAPPEGESFRYVLLRDDGPQWRRPQWPGQWGQQ